MGDFMIFKIDFKKLIISLAIPLIVGAISAFITMGQMDIYSKIKQPPLAPSSVLFPIVWTILYLLMGISFYLVWTKYPTRYDKTSAYIAYAVQLFLNFIWSPIFFNAREYLIAFLVLIALWVMVIVMTVLFYRISKPAGILQIPYILWLTFAGYLNLAIYILNR